MPPQPAPGMWDKIKSWFSQNATKYTLEFLPETNAVPLPAYAGYVRLWLVEGYLAQSRNWGANQFPAMQGGVTLNFLGSQPTTFSALSRPDTTWTTPGVRVDFPMTPLIPFNGGVVEVEAALYRAATDGPLGIAVTLLGGLASLFGPPLAGAAAIADKVSSGLGLIAGNDTPVLGLHWSAIAEGGNGNLLTPGYLIAATAPGGRVTSVGGKLVVATAQGQQPIESYDYLVLRIECRTERDDWRFPDLDALIRTAGQAFIQGEQSLFTAKRTEAIARAWNSADLTPMDRKRVALLVKGELDGLGELGLLPGPRRTIDAIAQQHLVDPADPELDGLKLEHLLSG